MRRASPSPPAVFAAAVVVFLPALFPGMFSPLGHAFPSLFSTDEQKRELWSPLPYQGWKPCLKPSISHALPLEPSGYIQVFLDGGLNQQRMGICDAVAVAKILNATLVVPHFEVNPVWKDSSSFEEIFDVDHFINSLKDEVSIIKALPKEFSWSTREYYGTGIRATRIKTAPLHASANWYLESVSPILQSWLLYEDNFSPAILSTCCVTASYGIAAIAPFSHRLAFDDLPADLQRLRCKVNFQALDMAAHSACNLGGGRAEQLALAKYRQVIWQGRVLNSQLTDEELRNTGRCPLTPEEIGLLLVALGFDSRTRLYLASHKVYGGEARISSLRKLFPLMEDKRSLASEDELASVEGKASVLAALDYYISMHSDIFISASPGNTHNALLAHRTYENLKTIRPNMALLGRIFVNKSMEWPEFQQVVQAGHKGRYGQIRLRKATQSIYTYPAPDFLILASISHMAPLNR
ncbi:unnamed protein product [Miscanthus lutarioriparius]|uniref:O-fucosyltransferase family protein n=1 Tax=Miscanthus lutarioriparius TaxID=422564 RepID=A0A811NMK7_9POAL|nr:unnamed protein product [Miscanthus lutarioriparius]